MYNKTMNKKNKNLFYWLLYDAGNSFIVSAIGGLYLAQWLVLDKFELGL